MMDLVFDLSFVKVVDLLHRLVRYRRQARSRGIFFDLCGPLAAGDRASDRWKHQNPTQSHLGKGSSFGNERFQSLDRLQAAFVINSGKSFAAIEGFPFPIERSMIIARKGTRGREFTGEHSGGQGKPSQNASAPTLSFLERDVARTLPKNIEDDLHRLHLWIFDRFESLFDFFDANAIVAQFAGGNQIAEYAEDFRHVIDGGRRTMKLQEVE